MRIYLPITGTLSCFSAVIILLSLLKLELLTFLLRALSNYIASILRALNK
jgi:hypothetical protein